MIMPSIGNGKYLSEPVVQDMLTLITIRIICLSHGSSFASMNNKLVFLCICYLLCSIIFVIAAYKNTRYAYILYIVHRHMIRKYMYNIYSWNYSKKFYIITSDHYFEHLDRIALL